VPHDIATITLIGGPTALIEHPLGLRLLTDPTFSPPGEYPGGVTLTKTSGPALTPEEVGAVDAVVLSHDQHADNLDPAGREYLASAPLILTTPAGAKRLGPTLGNRVVGLAPGQSHAVYDEHGYQYFVEATPARHGPEGIERVAGDVIGFLIYSNDSPAFPDNIYITGDTVWYEGVAEVARRDSSGVGLVIAMTGAAQTRGPFNLTMSADDAVQTAHAFPHAIIVPVHYEGWAHFTQNLDDVVAAFAAAGLSDRLHTLELGKAATIAS
jgi:L-ascorbate metabolism protein UlaG (beta-lactamase superfamily)